MASWAGFSEEELRKVKNTTDTNTLESPDHFKKTALGHERHRKLGPDRRKSPTGLITNTKMTAIDPSMMLQKQQQGNYTTPGCNKIPKEKRPERTADISNESESKVDAIKVTSEVPDQNEVGDLDDKEALQRDLISLEKFRTQQKAIEEANKQKKALLSKTLSERKQRAKKEAYKLEHIQKELSKLDTLLTADVQVIRNKIEDASRDFMDAQRRFEKAEIEYIASKVDVHTKSELKEQLTDHLYTIIHQNELRKAKKLADLMKELDMEDLEEDFCMPELPPLSSFQPSTMAVSPTGSAPFLTRSKESHNVIQTVVQQENINEENLTVQQSSKCDQEPSVTKADSKDEKINDKDLENETVFDTDTSVERPEDTTETSKNNPTRSAVEYKSGDGGNEVNGLVKSSEDTDPKSPIKPCDSSITIQDPGNVENDDTILNTMGKSLKRGVPSSWLFSSDKSQIG